MFQGCRLSPTIINSFCISRQFFTKYFIRLNSNNLLTLREVYRAGWRHKFLSEYK